MVLAVGAFLVDLSLFSPDKGAFVDVWVDFDVRVVAELQGVPFGVIDWHLELLKAQNFDLIGYRSGWKCIEDQTLVYCFRLNPLRKEKWGRGKGVHIT